MFNSGFRGRRENDGQGSINPQVKYVQTKSPQPYISGWSISGSDDTALNPAGGQTVLVNGSGFATGASATLGGSQISVVTVVSPTQISFTAPANAGGSYTLIVYNSSGGAAILVPGLTYSSVPTWTTAAGSIGSYYETTAIASNVVATSDSAITYSLASGSLPTGATLYANGVITGTAPVDSGSTTYTFNITATDAELQDTTRTFTMTINTDVVTWNSPADGTTYALNQNTAMSNVTLSASDAAGYAVSYSANTLPTGVSVSGNVITGTPITAGNVTSLVTATAALSSRMANIVLNWVVSPASTDFFTRFTNPGNPNWNAGGMDVWVDSSGNSHILIPYRAGESGSGGAIVAKFDSSGTVLWQKYYYVTGWGSWTPGGITGDSNYIYVAVNRSANTTIMQLDLSGNINWQKEFNAGNNAVYVGKIALQASTNNLFVSGWQSAYPDSGYNTVTLRLNSSGTLLGSNYMYGGSNKAFSVAVDPSTNYYYYPVGWRQSGATYWPLVSAWDATRFGGAPVQNTSPQYFNNLSASSMTDAADVVVDSSSLYAVFSGVFGSDNSDGLIVKGNKTVDSFNFAKKIYSANGDTFYGITLDSSGNIYVCGITNFYDMTILKFNNGGTLLWQRKITTSPTQSSFAGRRIRIDGSSMIITGVIASGPEGFLLKLPTDGSKTGSWTLNGVTYTYQASSLTVQDVNSSTLNPNFSTGSQSYTLSNAAVTTSTQSLTIGKVSIT